MILIFCIGLYVIQSVQAKLSLTTVAGTVGLTCFTATVACAYAQYCEQQDALKKSKSFQDFISYFTALIKKAHIIKKEPSTKVEQQLMRFLLVSEAAIVIATGNYLYQKKSLSTSLNSQLIVYQPDYNRNLYDVVRFGDATEVKRIFDSFAVGADIKISPYEDYRGDLMEFALVHDNASVVQALMQRNYPRKENYLKRAIELQKPVSINYLLMQPQSQQYLDEALVTAALWSDKELIEKLELKGAKLDAVPIDNVTPFAASVISGHYLIVDWLYKKITANLTDQQKNLFLEKSYTDQNKTALDIAIEHGHWSIVHWLGEQGAKFTQVNLKKAQATGTQYIINEVTKYVK